MRRDRPEHQVLALSRARRGLGGHRATEALHLALRHACAPGRGRGAIQRGDLWRMMGDLHIDYEALAQRAMRGMVRDILLRVAKTGLPGEHHFYIAFGTDAPGVVISNGAITGARDQIG